ncbi:MAG: hypothetical protein ACYTJ0_12385, partial [Planctomycetota bacterium]
AEWNDRQLTMIDDSISRYGISLVSAFNAYHQIRGGCGGPNQPGCHPSIRLGRCDDVSGYNDGVWTIYMSNSGNWPFAPPINFTGGLTAFGSFRIPNSLALSRYLSDRFYDPVFYAPKDRIVNATVEPCREDPCEFCWGPPFNIYTIFYSSYCLSPAAMFNPDVMRAPSAGGWQDPWSLDSGFRSPAMSHARFPDLKTHMIEHHWLQNARADCNPAFEDGAYDECEPYYFNHGRDSVPVTLFYDGHVGPLGVLEAEAADARVKVQSGDGLWSRDTPFGTDGYFIDAGYDFSATSFHILTTDGIRGRDTIAK